MENKILYSNNFFKKSLFSILLAHSIVACGQSQTPNEAEANIDSYQQSKADFLVESARLIAGKQFESVVDGYLCREPKDAAKSILPAALALASPIPIVKSFTAFDNLFYIGVEFVGSWVLKTSDGLILFDTMFNEKDAENIIEDGIRKLGMDPANIKHIVISHGHFDHYGGVRYFQDKYNATVWMGKEDWLTMEAGEDDRGSDFLARFMPEKMPLRGNIASDGHILELGGETVKFVTTPGHTEGTLSAVISVKEKGKTHYITMWGGTAMPDTSGSVQGMHNSLLKLWGAGREVSAIGVISTHAFVEDSFGRAKLKKSSKNNPFNLGKEGYNKMMAIHSECILAQQARLESIGN
jgi:metallo-beta-lactamase class B